MVTLAQVAAAAGVSPSTVSYVLSGKRAISGPTRARVEEAIERLGYHPHAGARTLAGRRSHIIGLVVPLHTDVHVPIMMEIAISATVAARQHGYDVLLMTNDEGPDGVRRVARSGLTDGVILMDVQLDDPRIAVLRETGIPAALIGLPADPHGLACVDHDFVRAGALCVEHLADLGHREVALIGYAPAVYARHAGYAERTLTGFRQAAAERGLRVLHRPCKGTYESTAGVLAGVLADRPATTGFVVQNEKAIGPLLSLLRNFGRAVPEEASVVALCPEELAEQHSPRLTAVTGPAKDLGRRAVELVRSRLDGRTTDEVTLLAPVLTIRESSGTALLRYPPGASRRAGTLG
ncbi:LacI family DNA-binding transcriptional regulator [Streptomyces sp. S.PNR 29]|uniref:LacI family DNA-binding transcriptional regulator n=1 Tax=Streptomyces sp. S.PNR 29 TaxID=2973805 RepID=UPI0025AF8F7E|nr:LacI family DNA-binding transcriptional regulator [Streptomyces sp. S.PNR 29]MDN0198909.1 LacI family transcriptional regulator [Streptomyces sp. S.PNR 29]